jgi:hypothetical protein
MTPEHYRNRARKAAYNPSFRDAIERAIADGVDARLAVITKAAENDWRAASWWLEHCQAEHFARNRTSGESGAVNVGIKIVLPRKETLDQSGIVLPVETVPQLTEGDHGK